MTELADLRWKDPHPRATGGRSAAKEWRDELALDDQLARELETKVSQALRSAQEVAHTLVTRAEQRDRSIRQKTDERCNGILAQAEHEATAILQRAAREAVRKVREAEDEVQDIVAAAHARRDRVLAELAQQSGVLEDRIARLRSEYAELAEALDVVDRALREARAVLGPSPSGANLGNAALSDLSRRSSPSG